MSVKLDYEELLHVKYLILFEYLIFKLFTMHVFTIQLSSFFTLNAFSSTNEVDSQDFNTINYYYTFSIHKSYEVKYSRH